MPQTVLVDSKHSYGKRGKGATRVGGRRFREREATDQNKECSSADEIEFGSHEASVGRG